MPLYEFALVEDSPTYSHSQGRFILLSQSCYGESAYIFAVIFVPAKFLFGQSSIEKAHIRHSATITQDRISVFS